MSKTNQWLLTRLAELGVTVYDFSSEAALRDQLNEELKLMTVEHEEFQSIAGSLHNSSYEPCDWEDVQ